MLLGWMRGCSVSGSKPGYAALLVCPIRLSEWLISKPLTGSLGHCTMPRFSLRGFVDLGFAALG
jgi:hypothetical protein